MALVNKRMPVLEIKPPKLSRAEIARAERLQRKLFGNNPYNTLGPSPGRVKIVDRLREADGGGGGGPRGPAPLTIEQQIKSYTDMLNKQQQSCSTSCSRTRASVTPGEMASMAGFGAALQGYASDLWGQTASGYQNAAAAQQSMAAGLGGQMAQGLAESHAQEAALAGQLGYTGGTELATPEAGAAQVASEGGANTGAMMGQVGGAWGGYGATRPDTIGFMTGQNQMQLAREQLESDRDLKSEFLKLGMENPATAFDMWSKVQENKRQNVSTTLAQQTLRTNVALQQAKLRQQYIEMRQDAKTQAQKTAADKWYKSQKLILDQQDLAIDQQNANTASQRADAYAYGQYNPTPPAPKGYAAGNYQQKVGKAMKDVDGILAGIPKKEGALNAVFASLWPQIEPYVSGANKERAKKMLRKAIGTKVAHWTPTKGQGGSGDPLDDYRT